MGSHVGSAEFTVGGAIDIAVLNLTKAMADIGITSGVRLNAINPGLIETDRFSRNVERAIGERSVNRNEAINFLLSSHGTTRVDCPDGFGALVAQLASSRADFTQGSVVDMDGGAIRSL